MIPRLKLPCLVVASLFIGSLLWADEEKKPTPETAPKADEKTEEKAEETSSTTEPDVLAQALEKAKGGDLTAAMLMVETELKENPSIEACSLYVNICRAMDFFPGMMRGVTEWLKLEPKNASLYRLRGEVHFFSGDFKESVADFDTYLEAEPDKRPHLWQLGMSLYYVEDYARGKALFEEHQKVNAGDVENAVWHYLCVARLEGVEAAKKGIYPYAGDRRGWARAVHDLYAGTGTPETVLKATESAENPAEKNARLSYSHLYLGLHDEVQGKKKEALEHYKLAFESTKQVEDPMQQRLSSYMKQAIKVLYEERQPSE